MCGRLIGEPEFVSTRFREILQSNVIAVIDDDDDVRAALGGLLESLGYQSRLFGSADSFLAAQALEFVDGIISDIQMPGTSGLQLAEEISICKKPIILITAFPTHAVRQRALAAGVRCVLVKPFDSNQLIDALLNRRSSSTAERA